MTYNKKTWESGQKLTADGLNNIENGVAALAAAQDNAQVDLPVVFFNLGDITDEAESEDGFKDSRFINLFNQGKNIIINLIKPDLISLFTFKSFNTVSENPVMIFNHLNANLNVNDPNAEMQQSTTSEIVNNELVFNFDGDSYLQSITLNQITYNLTTSTVSSSSDTLWSLNPITTEDPENPGSSESV